MKVIHLAHAVGTVAAIWNTFYAFESGRAYLQLTNNDIIQLNFTLSGDDLLLVDNQQIEPLTTAPTDSSVFLFNERLYAFYADDDNTSNKNTDVCGDGSLGLSEYNSDSGTWDLVALNFSSIGDSSFYQSSSYLTPMLSSASEMYIYGGLCNGTAEVTSRLLSFNPSTGTFANISTSTKPAQFYGAANLNSPNPQTQLMIGGLSGATNSWLSMLQLATWGFSTGWSFEQAQTAASTTVNSRKFALALPVFLQLPNSTDATILDYYQTKSVLLLGGEAALGKSILFVSKLSTNSNTWTWSNLNSTFTSESVIGAATIFNTLVVVNGTAGVNEEGFYTVNLYDTTSMKLVKSLKQNTQSVATATATATTAASSGGGTLTLTKAILGTILPLSAIGMAIGAAIFFLKRRKSNKEEEFEDYDYQIGNYYELSTLGSGRGGKFSRVNHHEKPVPPMDARNFQAAHYRTNNDTNSTLEEMSIDLWVRKRQEFDQAKKVGVTGIPDSYNSNNNFSASSETLSSAATVISMSERRNPFQDAKRLDDDEPSSALILPVLPVPPPPLAARLSSPSVVNKSVSILKKSLSFSTTNNAQYDRLKKKLSTLRLKRPPSMAHTLIDDEFDDEFESEPYSRALGQGASEEEDDEGEGVDELHNDDESVDDNLDVQVLVSSKRRSVLRVMNPDLASLKDIQEDTEDETSLRQRVPSGEKDIDDI